MSKVTKRKHVTKEVTEEFALPEEGQQVVKVVSSKGNNLHEVQTSDGEIFLVSMPTKFRKNVWIKRGDFVIVQPIEEGDKVKAEISHILYKPQITYIQQQGKWPSSFDTTVRSDGISSDQSLIPDDMLPPSCSSSDEGSDDEERSDSEEVLHTSSTHTQSMGNPNRHVAVTFADSNDDDDDDDDNDDSDKEKSCDDR